MTSLAQSAARGDRADRAFVRRAALDVLQRTPKPSEVKMYAGAPRDLVARRMLGSLEARQAWLEDELFYFLLIDRFRPRTANIEQLPARMVAGTCSMQDATAEILLSTSFSLRNPGNDTFVTVVMEQCLGVEVQDRRWQRDLEAGKKLYDGQRARFFGSPGDSQADVIKIALTHERFARHSLDRHHRRLFGRPLPTDGAGAATVARLHADAAAFFPILAQWLASDEYVAGLAVKKVRSDRQFIRSLYTDLLERTPDDEEMRNMRNALLSMADSTPLRAVMAKVILDSKKAKLPTFARGREAAFVNECFARYLGRAPTQAESTKFIAVLARGGADPALVVRALVGSPEYQLY